MILLCVVVLLLWSSTPVFVHCGQQDDQLPRAFVGCFLCVYVCLCVQASVTLRCVCYLLHAMMKDSGEAHETSGASLHA